MILTVRVNLERLRDAFDFRGRDVRTVRLDRLLELITSEYVSSAGLSVHGFSSSPAGNDVPVIEVWR